MSNVENLGLVVGKLYKRSHFFSFYFYYYKTCREFNSFKHCFNNI